MMARALNISGNSDWEMVAVKTTCGELTFQHVQSKRKNKKFGVTFTFFVLLMI